MRSCGWCGAASTRLGEPFGPLIKLLILTGQRREEVNGMTVAGELAGSGLCVCYDAFAMAEIRLSSAATCCTGDQPYRPSQRHDPVGRPSAPKTRVMAG